MPPLPLDERIVVIQRPKNISLCEASPQTIPHHSSQISTSSNGQITRASRPHFSQPHFYSPTCKSLTLECKRRSSRPQKATGDHPIVPPGYRHVPSHCHSNGTVTLSPRLPSHTHTIDIRLTLDKSGRTGISNSLGRSGSAKGTRGKCVPSHSDQIDRRSSAAEQSGGCEHKSQRSRHGQLLSSTGGVLQFVPAQAQQYIFKNVKEKENSTFLNRPDPEFSLLDHKISKLGTVQHSLPYHHNSVPVPHAAILNSNHPSSSPPQPAHIPVSFHQYNQPRSSRHRDHRPHILHGLPLSPCTSHAGGFPSPDHTCTIDCSHPFGCGCWRLIRCRGSKGHSSSCQGGGDSSSTSFSCTHNVGAVKKRGKEMGLRSLGGCLSAASTSNTSSTNSTVSEHRSSLFKPLHCASCSSEAGNFESPAILRKKMVGGCLPCMPLSSSAPLRAIQSCVTGCNPKASHTGSSTCSYCSSDPIVVTFNPRRCKPPGRSIGAPHSAAMFQADDDDYSVRTIWPEELSRKMTHSTAQGNHCAGIGIGVGKTASRQIPNESKRTGLAHLNCEDLQEYAHSQFTDRAGRRRLHQDKMAALDFTGCRSGTGYDEQRSSFRTLLDKDDVGTTSSPEHHRDTAYPSLPHPRSPSPPSPVSFSPPPSAPSTLIKPKPWQRDREGGHSLPSAQSLHLALNSLNRDPHEEKSRMHLSLPLSSSLPASLSDESAMTPDAENAVVSAILPFLFLGNERDAQDLDLLLRLNIGYVVNVTTHLPLYHLKSGLHYKRLPATDNSKQNLRQYFEEVFEFIEEAYQSGQGVLVHCQAGVSRSATIVIAYLMKHTLMTMTDAYKYVRSRRPVVSPNLNFMGQLLEFERDLNSGVTPRILMPKLDGVETQVMKGDTPVNSTMSVGQARKLVEQLKIEASFCRIKVSKAAADLMAYCDAHACDDPLITPVPTSENPFREKKFFCALL
ncbi:uncharacterized protein si:dkey-175m17.7 [Corythoichthys intestinalis]|uniref:uncharacterized protein si:dkey-175m17.7 n=1 Tax=Corythoichthys intestinalis TaxID=161448 RepID=UPI0025A546DD|nr:uncharacterized protein si:dkey-175m17.7 [Corythoichthys intestinalis]XP_061801603.1 uncharacterized protein LOC133592930 [Nerophis lumbriciformis]